MAGERQDTPGAPPDGTNVLLRQLLELCDRVPPDVGGARGTIASFVRLARAAAVHTERQVLERPWLSVVVAGAQEVRTAVGRVFARAGQALLLPARTSLERRLWSDRAVRGWQAIELEILAEAVVHGPLVESVFGRDGALREPVVLHAGRPALAQLIRLCDSLLEPDTHPRMVGHQLEGVLLALALENDAPAVDGDRARSDLVLAVRQLVRADPAGDVGPLAPRLGLSPAALRRRLARHGTSLRRLVRDERMGIASLLLRDGRLNVSEVAIRCGYDSPAKFSRQFRRAFGVLPSRYRAGVRADRSQD
jgi:AraC-like DNA-binding protein